MPGVNVPPGFVRPDPEPEPDLPTIRKSVSATLNSGSILRYSTLTDYVDCLIAQGAVRDVDDLIQNYPQLIGEIFFQWVSTGQLGCLFAAKLARKPRENRWLPIIQIGALEEGERLGGFLNAQLDAASERHEAAVIIFPDVNGAGQVIKLVNTLCSDPSGRWYRTENGIDPDPAGRLSLIGLRWILRDDRSVNYVLGFSALPTMPLTRQSPFTALFFRIISTKRTPAHREEGRVQVHLADLDSTFYPQQRHDQVWELTKKYRADRVEQVFAPVARARVTFAVPAELAPTLCAAKAVALEKDDPPPQA